MLAKKKEGNRDDTSINFLETYSFYVRIRWVNLNGGIKIWMIKIKIYKIMCYQDLSLSLSFNTFFSLDKSLQFFSNEIFLAYFFH